jgi:hypothetical protein
MSCGEPDPDESVRQCTTTADCSEGEACRGGLCLSRCSSDSDCNDGETCGLGNLCIRTCEGNGDCKDGETCEQTTGACFVEGTSFETCSTDNECGATEYCGGGTCLPDGCSEDAHCVNGEMPGSTNICGESTNACSTGCRENSDCESDEICNEQTNTCRPAGCTMTSCGDFQTCEEVEDGPSECRWTGNCDSDFQCEAYADQIGEDVPYTCQNRDDQGVGECKVKPECQSDDDCSGGQICEIASSEDGRNTCRAGCRCDNGEDCEYACGLSRPVCNDSNECASGCQTNSDCSGDNVCYENECRASCTSFSSCQGDDQQNGYVCRSPEGTNDSICRPCESDNQCPATKFCKKDGFENEETNPGEGLGLCRDIPPACPKDNFGDNHAENRPYEIGSDELPFETSGEMQSLFCNDPATQPDYSNETDGNEWWKFSAQTGKVIEVSLEYDASVADLDLALKNGTGNTLMTSSRVVNDDGGDGGQEKIVYGVDASSDFLLQVRGSIVEDNVEYDLSIDVRDPRGNCDGDGQEPNDSIDDVSGGSGLDANTTYDLSVCGSDKDFFKVEADANQIVSVVTEETPPRLGEIDLVLYDSEKSVIPDGADQVRTSGDQGGGKHKLEFTTRDAGTYYVEVRVVQGVGKVDYKLRWTQSANQCADDYETNDTCPDEAFQLDRRNYVGQTKTISDLSICTDKDFYAINLNPKDRIDITATYNQAQSQGELQVDLFGPNSCTTRISANTTENTDGNTVTVDLSHNVPLDQAGTFYIQAQRFQGVGNIDHSMDISIDSEKCIDDNLEPNDSQQNATMLDRNSVMNSGEDAALVGNRICDTNADWYCTQLNDGDDVKFESRVDSGQDLDAYLFDPQGNQVTSSTTSAAIETVSHTATQDGDYCVRIEGKQAVRTDYKLLTYINGQGPNDPDCPDIYENNDTCTDTSSCEATSISDTSSKSNGKVEGLLSCQSDDDWYETCVEPGQRLEVTTEFRHSRGDVDLYMWEEHADFTDNTEAVSSSTTSNDNETVSDRSNKEQCYYYRVTTQNGDNNYDLSVTKDQTTQCTTDANGSAADAKTVEVPGITTNRQKCEDQADWYEVDLEGGEKFEAYIPHDSTVADLDLTLYEQTGSGPSQVAESSSQDDDESLVHTPSTSGTYFVEVTTKGRARIPYELLLYADEDGNDTIDDGAEGPADRVCPDRFENNDSQSGAAQLNVGSYDNINVCNDSTATSSDKDLYRVFVPKDATITATASFTHDDGDIDMRMYRGGVGSSSEVQNSPSDSSSSGSGTEEITYTNSQAGETVYIELYGANGFEKNYYSLDVSLSFSGMCNEDQFMGNNGSKADAASLTAADYDGASGSYMGLKLCETTQSYSGEDWYELGTNPGDVTLTMEHRQALGEIEMELQDDAGNVVATAQDVSGFNGNVKEIDQTNVSGNGPYYLRVHPDGSVIRNAYDLWASFGGSTPAEPMCPDTFERNDERSTDDSAPLTLSSGTLQTAEAIACGAEKDWYQVDLDGSTTYHWDVFHEAASDLAIELRDGPTSSAGYVTDSNGDDIKFGNNSTSADEQVTIQPSTAGTYYLGVENQGSDEADYPMQLVFDDAYKNEADCPEDQYGSTSSSFPGELPDGEGIHPLGACSPTGTAEEDNLRVKATEAGSMTITVMYDSDELQLAGNIVDPNNGSIIDLTGSGDRLSATVSGLSKNDEVDITVGAAPDDNGPYFLKVEQN